MLGIHLLLAVVLAAFSDGLSPMGVTVAAILVYLVLKLGAGLMGLRPYVRRLELGTCFVFWFAWEVVRASIDVARVVFSLGRAPRPAIVPVRLMRRDERVATVVGCLLTLTPGTMAMDYDPDSGLMYVHALDADEAAGVEAGVHAIEARLLAWMDAGDSPATAREKCNDA
ncbi:MAG: Na+/H+ antiporter subunit E [Pseudazoarcus pumilus]|nr:Na+/H+ antiporter subunit E [Pseudazoarcus pumilus]